MEIIVHTPDTPAGQKELQKLAANIHMQQIAYALHALFCPQKQKLQLFDAVAETLLSAHPAKKTNP